MTEYMLEWTRQNLDFNTLHEDVFQSIVASPLGGLYGVYQTNGVVKGAIENKGGYDIALFCAYPTGQIDFIKQSPSWNTPGHSRLSQQALATDGSHLYFVYWSNQALSGQTLAGNYDCILCKVELNGTLVWAKQTSFPNASNAWNTWPALTLDTQGNPCIAFTTTGTIPNSADANAEHVGRVYDSNLVVCKFDQDGELMWARQRPEWNTTHGTCARPTITCDSQDMIYVGYTSTGALPSKQKQSITSTDVILLKLDDTGSTQWIKQDSDLNTRFTNTTPILHINSANELVIAYSTSGRVSEKTTYYETENTGHTDVVIAKLATATSDVIWLRQRTLFNSRSNDTPYSILTDATKNIYVSFTASILDLQGQKVLREDTAIVQLSNFGDVEVLKYDNELNHQATHYRHTFPKMVMVNESLYVSYTYTTFSREFLYNQQYGEVLFQTRSDIVLKKFLITPPANQFLIWTKQDQLANTSKRDNLPSLVVDSSNNMYTLYQTDGQVQGFTKRGPYDVALFKSDSNGNVVWSRQHASWNTDGKAQLNSRAMVIDSENNLYFTYSSRLASLTGHTRAGLEDVVLIKVDSDGNTVWTHETLLPNTSKRNCRPTLSLDASGHIVLAFLTDGTVPLDKVGSGSESHTPAHVGKSHAMNLVVCKFDPVQEELVWSRQYASLNSTQGSSSQPTLITTSTNAIVVAYTTSGALPGFSKITHSSTDIVVAKLSASGAILWRKQDTEVNTQLTNTTPILHRAHDDNVLLAYSASGRVDGSGNQLKGDTEVVVSKLASSTGSVLWANQVAGWNTSRQDTPYSITLDANHNIYVAYTTFLATLNNRKSSREDVALLKLSPSGEFLYAHQDHSLNHRLADYRHTTPALVIDSNQDLILAYSFTRFRVSNENLVEMERTMRLNGIVTRTIQYNMEEQTSTISYDMGDSDIVLVKVEGDSGGGGETNVNPQNSDTTQDGILPEGEDTEDPNTQTPQGAIIHIPIILDSSGAIVLYGENEPNYDYSYNVIMNTSTVSSALLNTYLQYVEVEKSEVQPESEFHFTYNPYVEADFRASLLSDISNQSGRVRNAKTSLQEFESGFVVRDGTLGELFVRYIADVLFHNPEAQAPIRNDRDIIEQIQQTSMLHEQFMAKVTSGLMDRMTYIGSEESEKVSSKNAYLRSVIEQLLLKVPERFPHSQDTIPVAFPFQSGDEISFLIRMNGTMVLDELQDYSTVGDGKFSQPVTENFLEQTIEGWQLDPANVRADSPSQLVTKMWKFTMILR